MHDSDFDTDTRIQWNCQDSFVFSTPGRYAGFAEAEDDEPFEEKMARLTATLETQFAKSTRLKAAIRENLAWLENRG